jgi:hypothetical protein
VATGALFGERNRRRGRIMKNIRITTLCLAGALGAALAGLAAPAAAADVGVSISIGQPGYYGRIDIGNVPPPVLVYPQPVVITPQPQYIGQPLYLRVPPGHAKRWSRYCGRYQACGQPVYFVQDDWYRQVYAPRYAEEHGGRGYRDNDRRGRERGDRDEGGGHDHGRHEGRGRGHD